jgi:VWFA-related protein
MLFRLFALSLLAASPALAARPVTVVQLDQILSLDQGKSDMAVARQVADFELTERLPASTFDRLDRSAPGPETRQALLILTDLSAFLNPPASAIPARATPDLATQHQIISLAADFARKTISHLPDFFATRSIRRFVSTPRQFGQSLPGPYQPLQSIGTFQDAVSYRGGREVINDVVHAARPASSLTPGITTSGVFGPLLGTVLVDIAHGSLFWQGWEQDSSGTNAVFRYVVPHKASHYEVGLTGSFQQFTGYHGTFTVDPVTGTILRLTIQADLRADDPIRRSDILVEYGPVRIAGKTYICPLRSISLSVVPSGFSVPHRHIFNSDPGTQTNSNDAQTSLSDVTFVDYHVFRAESRILSDVGAPPPVSPPASVPASQSPLPPEVAVAEPPPPLPEPPPATPVATLPRNLSPPNLFAPVVTPTPSLATQAPIPTLRVSSRLVYVDVVVRDNHGQVVRGLTQSDFRVSEDGVAQTVASFRAITGDTSGPPSTPPNDTTTGAAPASSASVKPDTLNLVLFDLVDTSPLNQTYARRQMLRFLEGLPPKTSITLFTLFILSGNELHVVPNPKGDASSLAVAARQLLSRSSPLFQSTNSARQTKDTTGSMPGLATPGGEDNAILVDLAQELSTENFQHSQVRADVVQAALRALEKTSPGFNGRRNLFWLAETFPPGGSAAGAPGSSGNALQVFGTDPTSRIAIYPISVLGLESDAIGAEMNGNGVTLGGTPGTPALEAQLDDRRSARQQLRESMEHIGVFGTIGRKVRLSISVCRIA